MSLRESVRALVLDPDDHVLLVRFHWDGLEFEEGFWANPGGGLEPGKTRAAALRRELAEECGLPVEEIGPEIWTKTAHFRALLLFPWVSERVAEPDNPRGCWLRQSQPAASDVCANDAR